MVFSDRMKTFTFALALSVATTAAAAIVACSSDDPAAAQAGADDGGTDSPSATDGPSATDSGSDAEVDPVPTPIGPGPYTLLYAGTITGPDRRPIPAGKATFDGAKLTGYEASMDERPSVGTNSVTDLAGSALFGIGRWSGGTTGGKFYAAGDAGLMDFPANGGFHYAIAIAADPIPSSGMTAYSTLAKTTATISDGSLAPGTITGTLSANLAGAATKVGFSVTLDIPGESPFTIASVGGVANASTAGTMPSAGLPGAFFDSTATLITSAASCGAGIGCTAAVYGVVIGPAAENIALVVHVFSGSGGSPKSVSGAIVFKK